MSPTPNLTDRIELRHLEKLFDQHVAALKELAKEFPDEAVAIPPRALVFELVKTWRGEGYALVVHIQNVGPTAAAASRFRASSGLEGTFVFEPYEHQCLDGITFAPKVASGSAFLDVAKQFGATHAFPVVESLGFDETRHFYHVWLGTERGAKKQTLSSLEDEWARIAARLIADWYRREKKPVNDAVFYFSGELEGGLQAVYVNNKVKDGSEGAFQDAIGSKGFPNGKELSVPPDSKLSLLGTPIRDYTPARRFFARVAARLETGKDVRPRSALAKGARILFMFHGEEGSQDFALRAEASRRLSEKTGSFVGGTRRKGRKPHGDS